MTLSDLIFSEIKTCRICHSETLTTVLSLQEQCITSRFPIYGDVLPPKVPMEICLCAHCGLIQLRQTTNPSELYEYEYGYRSGISHTMRKHLQQYYEEIMSKIHLQEGDSILDIGSNDATMLHYYSNQYQRIGIDPTGKQFQEHYQDMTLIDTYFTKSNVQQHLGNISCKIISSIAMFYDLPDPRQFVQDIYDLLEDDGLWTCEQSYLVSMLQTNSIDTICHEHLEYYSLHSIKYMADQVGFKIVDISLNPCNGGSIRLYLCKQTSTCYKEATTLIQHMLQQEKEYGIFDPQTYTMFLQRCQQETNKLCTLIDTITENHQQIWLYGASTKGNCLLQYANLDVTRISYAVERNLQKVGKMTVTGIPIIAEETMRQQPPEYLLVLPWHFREEIIQREDAFLEQGGQLIFPFPTMTIYSKKERVIITGCDGHIASYVIEQFSPKYCLYGIRHPCSKHSTPRYIHSCPILTFSVDVMDKDQLTKTLSIVQPHHVIHLAAISSSLQALEEPEKTIQINGMSTVYLCDILYRFHQHTTLFHASSSEIYKGYINYKVQEDDPYLYHRHPYSIGKILGHSMVDFYRNTYHVPFSNGILFTTESPRKSSHFLLNKVAEHAKHWKQTKQVLQVGSLDSIRNIIHTKDVACAIEKIVQHPVGDNYLICHEYSVPILDMVIDIYKLCEIELIVHKPYFYEKHTHELVIEIIDIPGLETQPSHIQGYPTKLKQLGWIPTMTIPELLQEIVNDTYVV
jgi:GDP-D-mannose dehydratase